MTDEVTVTLPSEVARWLAEGRYHGSPWVTAMEACRAALAEPVPEPAKPITVHNFAETILDPEVPAEPERPEWLLLQPNDSWSKDLAHRMVLAGHLQTGDVILWGDGEWRAITEFDRNRYGNGVASSQWLSPAALVVVRVSGDGQ